MERALPLESTRQVAQDGGAAAAAPPSKPLTMVSAAVAGDNLETVAASASEAIGRPIAISIPALGEPIVWPRDAIRRDALRAIAKHTAAVIRGEEGDGPTAVADVVRVRIGEQTVGILVAVPGIGVLGSEEHAWLEAGAEAAAVHALMREAHEGGVQGSRRALLRALLAGPPADAASIAGHARRLGFDLSSGAVAICAVGGPEVRGQTDGTSSKLDDVIAAQSALLAEMGEGRIYGLVPPGSGRDAQELGAELLARGMQVAISGLRRDAYLLHEALREAELLLELTSSQASLAGQEETYRLLIGVLHRDPEELVLLRQRTISPLAQYDSEHDTELLGTLQAFLAHHGSTTETADAMGLHRHTVGYRLSRVQEVSGLSPYESGGRERLSLGLKAHQILTAEQRRSEREQG